MNKNYRLGQADARYCLKFGGPAASCHALILQCCVRLGELAEGRAALRHLPGDKKAADMVQMLEQAEKEFNQSLQHADDKNYREAEKAIIRYCMVHYSVQSICRDQ